MDTPAHPASATGSNQPPPPPFGSPRPRHLRRRPDHGHIAGVCAGVAEYFNVDPVIVRIAAVVLAFSGPGVVAYILAWIFVPPAGPSSSDPFAGPSDRRDRGAQILGIVLLAISVSILWGGWWSPARRWIFPLGLMALGAWLLLRRDDDDDRPGDAPGGPAGPTPGSAPGVPRPTDDATWVSETLVDEGAGGGATLPPWDGRARGTGPPPEGPAAVTPVGRRRRIVAPVVMGALLLWTGIAFLADVSLQSGLAIALCIVGVGFVLGAFVGGSRALIVPAVLVGAALVATSVVDIPLSGPVGQRTWTPQTLAQVDDHYELSAGQGRLDLTALTFEEGDHLEIAASIGVGHLIVEVPDGVAIDVAAQVSAGDTVLFGQANSGVGISVDRVYADASYTGTIALDLEVGLGQIEVFAQRPDGAPATPGTTTTLG